MFDLIHIAQAAEEAAHAAESSGVLGTLGINLKLFIAQLVNFGIILFVLWKWVFGPVSKGLEARTKKIEDSLSDADRIEKEKTEFQAWREEQVALTRQEAAGIVSLAKQEAEKVRQELLEQTKAEQTKIVSTTREQLASDQSRAVQEIKKEIAGLVINATQQILEEKLDATKDKALIQKALKEVVL
jgi:F-type H+-transporting ATPase subunit b